MQPFDKDPSVPGRWRRRVAAIPILAALAALGLVAAGCGSGSASPGVAQVATGSTTTTDSSPDASESDSSNKGPTAFSSCMRSHGVPKFPDPSPQGGINISPAMGVNPDSAQFQAAQKTCEKLVPPSRKVSPAQQAKAQQQMLKFSACMRSHGVPNFPDPTFTGGGAKLSVGKNLGIDPGAPQFQAAQKTCQNLMPAGKGGPGAVTSVGGRP